MFVKYGFGDFFEMKRRPSSVYIQYRPECAQCIVAQNCLIALCDKRHDIEYKALQKYALDFFDTHLRKQSTEFRIEHA